jgi:hypothetical protein
MPTKTTRPTGTLPTGYDTGILIKVPDEQHVLHVGRWEPEGYAEQLFPRQHPRVEAVRNPVSVQKFRTRCRMTEHRKFRCFCHQGRALPSVQPVRLSAAARPAARREPCGGRGVELVACVKIRSGTEAVSMSATEDLSVDATRGTVRAPWGIGCIFAQLSTTHLQTHLQPRVASGENFLLRAG